jgi:hypothetical protein
VTAYRFLSPARIFSVLNRIEAQVAAGEWDIAAAYVRDLGDDAQQRKPAGHAPRWRHFIEHVVYLQIVINGKDGAGCAEELAALHSALIRIAGTKSMA